MSVIIPLGFPIIVATTLLQQSKCIDQNPLFRNLPRVQINGNEPLERPLLHVRPAEC